MNRRVRWVVAIAMVQLAGSGWAQAPGPRIQMGDTRPPWLVTLWANAQDGSLANVCGGVVVRATGTTVWFATAGHCGSFNYLSIGDNTLVEWPRVDAYRVLQHKDMGDLGVYSITWTKGVSVPVASGKPSSVWLVREGINVNPLVQEVDHPCRGKWPVLKPTCLEIHEAAGYDFRAGDSGSPVMRLGSPVAVISEKTARGQSIAEDLSAAWTLVNLPACSGRLDAEMCLKAARSLGFPRQGPARTIELVLSQESEELLGRITERLKRPPEPRLPVRPEDKIALIESLDGGAFKKKELRFLVWSGLVKDP